MEDLIIFIGSLAVLNIVIWLMEKTINKLVRNKNKNMLYLDKDKQKTEVDFSIKEDGKIEFIFSSNCGKFGTDEILDIHTFKNAEELLNVLQKIEDDE